MSSSDRAWRMLSARKRSARSKSSAMRWRSGLICWRSSSSRSSAAMASRESSQRGEPAAMADHKRLGPVAVAGGDGELAEQPAGFVGGRVVGKVADLLLECRRVGRGRGTGQAQGQGAAARQAAEHAGLGADGAGGRVVGDLRQAPRRLR